MLASSLPAGSGYPASVLAIEAGGLQKRYSGLFGRGGHLALAGVDLTVARGTAFGLIGPNGAGKTTFIKALLGVSRPTAGGVRVLGGDPEDVRVRSRLGYLPERLHLPNAWTPVAFLSSVCRLKGVEGAEIPRLLERVGLGPSSGRRIGGFSKGMRQRLGLAAALLGSPELLILDEPTDGVDPIGRVEVRNILAEERAKGATLFLNSHLLSETERVCDRIGVLINGRIVREGPLSELTAEQEAWRVRFSPETPVQVLTQAGFRPEGTPGVFHFEGADAQALNAGLDRARAAGALLVELTRAGRDLEGLLAQAVSASGGRPE